MPDAVMCSTLRFIIIVFLALTAGPALTLSSHGLRATAQNISSYDGAPAQATRTAKSTNQGPDISAKYLKQARAYRDQGRYELARQSYAQALSTCRSAEELAVIEKEMGGIELLLRTMR